MLIGQILLRIPLLVAWVLVVSGCRADQVPIIITDRTTGRAVAEARIVAADAEATTLAITGDDGTALVPASASPQWLAIVHPGHVRREIRSDALRDHPRIALVPDWQRNFHDRSAAPVPIIRPEPCRRCPGSR